PRREPGTTAPRTRARASTDTRAATTGWSSSTGAPREDPRRLQRRHVEHLHLLPAGERPPPRPRRLRRRFAARHVPRRGIAEEAREHRRDEVRPEGQPPEVGGAPVDAVDLQQ